jgi:hypothetical protein
VLEQDHPVRVFLGLRPAPAFGVRHVRGAVVGYLVVEFEALTVGLADNDDAAVLILACRTRSARLYSPAAFFNRAIACTW